MCRSLPRKCHQRATLYRKDTTALYQSGLLADAGHVATGLDWHRRRGTIATWFRTLKTGTEVKDRPLDSADDPRKWLAFDAVTAVHVADLTVLARERPRSR